MVTKAPSPAAALTEHLLPTRTRPHLRPQSWRARPDRSRGGLGRGGHAWRFSGLPAPVPTPPPPGTSRPDLAGPQAARSTVPGALTRARSPSRRIHPKTPRRYRFRPERKWDCRAHAQSELRGPVSTVPRGGLAHSRLHFPWNSKTNGSNLWSVSASFDEVGRLDGWTWPRRLFSKRTQRLRLDFNSMTKHVARCGSQYDPDWK